MRKLFFQSTDGSGVEREISIGTAAIMIDHMYGNLDHLTALFSARADCVSVDKGMVVAKEQPKASEIQFAFCPRCGVQMNPKFDPSLQVEIVGPDGKVHYTRPLDHGDVFEALKTPGYSVRGIHFPNEKAEPHERKQ